MDPGAKRLFKGPKGPKGPLGPGGLIKSSIIRMAQVHTELCETIHNLSWHIWTSSGPRVFKKTPDLRFA